MLLKYLFHFSGINPEFGSKDTYGAEIPVKLQTEPFQPESCHLTGKRRPKTSDLTSQARDRRPKTGDKRPETRDRRPQTGDWRPEAADRRLETGDWTPDLTTRTRPKGRTPCKGNLTITRVAPRDTVTSDHRPQTGHRRQET